MKRIRWLLLLAIMAALLIYFALPSSAKQRIPGPTEASMSERVSR
ncbi:MAG TPA: hypothetical protein VK191_03085 [Symbiobacteriaceae bacterium]|nr:hypothetical protein [Symbiobacteriaceae bacterium]